MLTTVAFVTFPGFAFAQESDQSPAEKPPSGESDATAEATEKKEDFPVDSGEFRADTAYLLRHDAYRYAHQFRQAARDRIVNLNLMVKNYGEELAGSKDRFEEVQTAYRTGMTHYFRGEYVQAIRKLEASQVLGDKLMKDFAEFYKNGATKILDETSRQMVDRELSMEYAGEGTSSSGEMAKHQFKLKLAYTQMHEGQEMQREDQYRRAVEHYRIAKLHAINTILDMEEDLTKRKDLAKKYKTDLLDAYGRLASSDK